MFPEVQQILFGRRMRCAPASVQGWRAAALRGHVFPGLTAAPGTGTSGMLLLDMTQDDWRTANAFEGPVYELRHLQPAEGGEAWAYVFLDRSRILARDWDPDRFRRELPEYLDRCRAWRAAR